MLATRRETRDRNFTRKQWIQISRSISTLRFESLRHSFYLEGIQGPLIPPPPPPIRVPRSPIPSERLAPLSPSPSAMSSRAIAPQGTSVWIPIQFTSVSSQRQPRTAGVAHTSDGPRDEEPRHRPSIDPAAGEDVKVIGYGPGTH